MFMAGIGFRNTLIYAARFFTAVPMCMCAYVCMFVCDMKKMVRFEYENGFIEYGKFFIGYGENNHFSGCFLAGFSLPNSRLFITFANEIKY